MSQAKESQDGKETKKSETGKTTAGGHLESSREYQRRDDRSREGLSEEKRRKRESRSSEEKISKYDKKRSLEREKTRRYKEKEEKVKKDVKSLTRTCKEQCKSDQPTKVTYVTGRKKSTRSEDSKDLESTQGASVESRIKTDLKEESTRWDTKKKEGNWTSTDQEKVRKRVPSSSSSSSSSSNSSDWEAPWERIENDERKKRKTTQ